MDRLEEIIMLMIEEYEKHPKKYKNATFIDGLKSAINADENIHAYDYNDWTDMPEKEKRKLAKDCIVNIIRR